MLPYVIVSGERELTRHSGKRSLHPVSYPYLVGMGTGIAMAHSPCLSQGFSIRQIQIQVGFVIHYMYSTYLGSSCRWQKHMH